MPEDQERDPPLRSPRDLYLDGIVVGATVTWLLSKFYDRIKVGQSGTFEAILFFFVIFVLFVGGVAQAMRLQGRG